MQTFEVTFTLDDGKKVTLFFPNHNDARVIHFALKTSDSVKRSVLVTKLDGKPAGEVGWKR